MALRAASLRNREDPREVKREATITPTDPRAKKERVAAALRAARAVPRDRNQVEKEAR